MNNDAFTDDGDLTLKAVRKDSSSSSSDDDQLETTDFNESPPAATTEVAADSSKKEHAHETIDLSEIDAGDETTKTKTDRRNSSPVDVKRDSIRRSSSSSSSSTAAKGEVATRPYADMGKEDLLRFSETVFWKRFRLVAIVS